MILEAILLRNAQVEGLRGYEVRDTATSLAMGIGNVGIGLFWEVFVVGFYVILYEITPLRFPANAWWAWVLLFFAEDLCYYVYHRMHHEVRLLWASHVIHHSSQHYNLSTALRQTWTPMTGLPFWAPLPLLGFAPWMIVTQKAINLLYQYWIHTEKTDRLPACFEKVFNTPSHHRLHHGSDAKYLDRNHAGILIVWDRLFGTFQPEEERPCYGLTKNIETFNPLRVPTHELVAIARDAWNAPDWRQRFGYVFRGPGWKPAGRGGSRAEGLPEPA